MTKEFILAHLYELARDCRLTEMNQINPKNRHRMCPASIFGLQYCPVNHNQWTGYETPCNCVMVTHWRWAAEHNSVDNWD